MMIFLLWWFYVFFFCMLHSMPSLYSAGSILMIMSWMHCAEIHKNLIYFQTVALWLYFLPVQDEILSSTQILFVVGSVLVCILDDISRSHVQKVNNHRAYTVVSRLLQGILVFERSPSRKSLSRLPLPGRHLHQDDQERQSQRLRSTREKQRQLLWCSRFKSRKLAREEKDLASPYQMGYSFLETQGRHKINMAMKVFLASS